MNSNELRKKFLEFFKEREHALVPSSSLVPDDPSVLLTTAGMQQFKPYYTGAADPMASPHPTLGGKPLGSKNAASIQKSFRTSDIDEVGDERHLTFFEMMGNFSFGGYFKKEAIQYAYDFIVKTLGLQIDYVSVFGGEGKVAADEESESIWKSIDSSLAVKRFGRADNFWGPTGNEGPCGPTTEIYVNGIEIWNIVFNQFSQDRNGNPEPLQTPGIDTGMGLERLAMVSQGKENIFQTDLFQPLIDALPVGFDERGKRIFADHARAIVFLLGDGITPSNKEAGYVLRRLIRRIIVHEDITTVGSYAGADRLGVGYGLGIRPILEKVIELYHAVYPQLDDERHMILDEFEKEREKFAQTLRNGLQELDRIPSINAQSAFMLYQTFGLPYEIIKELGAQKTSGLLREDFDKEFAKHQEISRAGQEKKFGGHGLLLDTGELKATNEEELKIVTRLHTATHLLQAALRRVLGETVHQAGSDITVERTRFDFTYNRKLTPDELKDAERLVNEAIERDLTMEYKEMPFQEAIATGALYSPREKYPGVVKVYSAWNPGAEEVFSKELCGGPHVTHTGEVGHFKILKEEAVGAGIRRLRAAVE